MNIEFIPFEEPDMSLLTRPQPAITKLPEWYKKKSPFLGETKKMIVQPDYTKNISIKWCNPFGDAIGAGYFIFLENDVQVNKENDTHVFVWLRGGEDFISTHGKEQIDPELIPEGFDAQPMKFVSQWGIKTPKGYSTMFTHPINRHNEPFLTLSGIVDTDDYHLPVNFPFLIKEDFEGVIEAGTPIAQVIPFKRDSWKSVIKDFDDKNAAKQTNWFYRKIHRAYKTNYWKRKQWK